MKDIQIYCDYNSKDSVKELGCKWNQDKRSWVCPLGISDANFLMLVTFQRMGVIHFIKEIVNDSDARTREDCFKPNRKLCYNIVQYNEDDLIDMHIEFNRSKLDELFIDE